MTRAWTGIAVAVLALAGGLPETGIEGPRPVRADESHGIAWRSSLKAALEEAKASKRPVFVAINAKKVDGGRIESASQLLREQVYFDPAIVERSKSFVCMLLLDPLSEADGAELRARFGIEGLIVSPQHLWLHADGALIQRKEYWEFGDVPTSVAALLELLDHAQKSEAVRQALPALGPDAASRAAWTKAAHDLIRTGPDLSLRRAAVEELAAMDPQGDGMAALGALLAEWKDPKKEEIPVLGEVARRLGRPAFESAVPGLAALLDAKDSALRSEAAVSLEYVGSPKAIEALVRRESKEKDEAVRSNLLRAIGRCGAKDAGARKALLRQAVTGSERVTLGALIGLAYFEGDADVARSLEKAFKGGDEGMKRTAFLWALVEIGDPKSATFLRAEAAAASKAAPSLRLLDAAVACFDGQRKERKAELDGGLYWGMNQKNYVPDPARSGRTSPKFTPKGDPASR